MATTDTGFKETTEIDLAGYLVLKGFKLIPPLKTRGRYIVFTFKDEPDLDEEWMKYFNQETSVDAYSLCNTIRKLRVQMRELRMQKGGEW